MHIAAQAVMCQSVLEVPVDLLRLVCHCSIWHCLDKYMYLSGPFCLFSNGTFALSREAALPANLSSDRGAPDRRARTDAYSDRPPQTEFFSDRRSQTDSFSDRRERRPQSDSFSDSAASMPEGRHHMTCHMLLLFLCCAPAPSPILGE